MDITKHIRSLLYDYSVVIVPDFGAFSTRYASARINKERNQIDPPKKEVFFNDALKLNDNLLASHIAKQEGIAEAESRKLIQEFVQDVKSRLSEGEPVHFNEIGEFKKEWDGSLTFRASEEANFAKDAYGLKPVDTSDSTTPETPVKSTLEEKIPTAPIIESTTANNLNSTPMASENNDINSQYTNNQDNGSKRTVSDLLASKAEELRSEREVYEDEEEEVLEEPENKRSLLGWMLPILILMLSGFMLWQLYSRFNGGDDEIAQLTQNDYEDVSARSKARGVVIDDGGVTEGISNAASNVKDVASKSSRIIMDGGAEAVNNTKEGLQSVFDDDGVINKTADEVKSNVSEPIVSSLPSKKTTPKASSGSSSSNSRSSGLNSYSNSPRGTYVIAGSFDRESGAKKRVKKLRAIGYEAFVVKSPTKYRAGVFMGSNPGRAETVINELNNKGFKGAWKFKY